MAASEPERALAALAEPDVRVVTLTLTEKGYKVTTEQLTLCWARTAFSQHYHAADTKTLMRLGVFDIAHPVTLYAHKKKKQAKNK